MYNIGMKNILLIFVIMIGTACLAGEEIIFRDNSPRYQLSYPSEQYTKQINYYDDSPYLEYESEKPKHEIVRSNSNKKIKNKKRIKSSKINN